MNKCNYENEAKNQDVNEGGSDGIILPYIETVFKNNEEIEVFALPGGKSVMGRKNAQKLALRYLANPNAKAKSPIAKLAEKHVTRIQGLCSETSVMGA